MRYASHTPNLIATKDFDNIIAADTSNYKRLIGGALAKCWKLWGNVNKRTKLREIVDDIISISLKTPGYTRWNATYNAIQRLMELRDRKKSSQSVGHLKVDTI